MYQKNIHNIVEYNQVETPSQEPKDQNSENQTIEQIQEEKTLDKYELYKRKKAEPSLDKYELYKRKKEKEKQKEKEQNEEFISSIEKKEETKNQILKF